MAKKKRKNTLIWVLVGLIVILIAAAVINNKRKPKGIEVTTEKVELRSIIETVTASGKIFPETEVKISSDVSGEIVELFVEEGDSVIVGQLLAKIDPDAYVSAVERGEASVNNAKAQLAMSRSSVENSRAQIENIKAQLQNAQKIHERNVKLLEDGVIAEAEFENSKSSLESLQANLRAAEATFRSSQESVNASQYTVKSAEASLKELNTNLQRTTISSPTDGIVSMLNVEQGERVVGTIQMTGTELMRISDFSTMEVQVEVSENDILRVALHDEVEIEVDAYFDKLFSGKVTEIANSASNTAQLGASLSTDQVTNFIVKIQIDPESYMDLIQPGEIFPLRPGMSASVEIKTEEVIDVISAPIQAVTTREKEEDSDDLEEIIFLLSGDTVGVAKVETGIQDDEYIQILSGLEEGQEIVTGPYNAISRKLESGEKIRVKESEKDKKEEKSSSGVEVRVD